MNLISEIEAAGTKVETFLQSIVSGASKLKKLYAALSGPVLAASMAVFYDTVKAFAGAEAAATAAASGNVPAAITLSETTVGLIKQVVTDFKSGEKTVVADFEALGIKL
jgi:hypothetical protein